ncbi:hypothetical protein D3C80_1112660 [compost metagenome]
MPGEFVGMPGPTMAGQVIRRRDGDQLAAAQPAHDCSRLGLGGDADRQVDALLDQVQLPVAEVHRQPDLRVGLGELQQQRHQPAQTVGKGQTDAQRAARGQTLLHHPGLGLLHQFENHPALFQIAAARRGQRQPPRAAHHQLAAQVLFQRGDLPGDHRAVHAELVGGRREAAQLGDADEQLHGIESIHY